MLKRLCPACILIPFLFIICNFQCQCDKEDNCDFRRATKTGSTFILPASSKFYQVGDTIILNTTIPFSQFNDLTMGTVPIQRYNAYQIFEIYEITGGSPYNTKFGGDKFDVIAMRGNVIFSGAANAVQTFANGFETDSLSGKFVSELIFVPRQTGKYFIFDNGGYLRPNQNLCVGNNYEIKLLKQWSVTSRNTEIPSEAGITGDLLCKEQTGGGGFHLPQSTERSFYFYIQ